LQVLIISGVSGSGKSLANKVFEDLGYYCVDNLPVPLLTNFFDLMGHSFGEFTKVALVIDARDKEYISDLPNEIQKNLLRGKNVSLLFLDAINDVLIRRYSTTRHKHPLSPTGSVAEGIEKERQVLLPIKEMANFVIDTSQLLPGDLRKKIFSIFQDTTSKSNQMTVAVSSFGFKQGLPANSDIVFDVRFINNPFFREDLKHKTGLDEEVRKFVLDQDDAGVFLKKIEDMLSFLLPRYEVEGKSYFQISIGCTGGQHRSVVMAQEVEKIVQKMGFSVKIQHRELS
jgi:UPF0042 nucleotide-binding protein